jgi:hypothetical protein
MGGLQSVETGILHLGYFSWIGAFSPGSLSGLSDEFRNALKDPNKINENLRLFEIVTGDSDFMSARNFTETCFRIFNHRGKPRKSITSIPTVPICVHSEGGL